MVLFVGPVVPLLWTFSYASRGFRSQEWSLSFRHLGTMVPQIQFQCDRQGSTRISYYGSARYIKKKEKLTVVSCTFLLIILVSGQPRYLYFGEEYPALTAAYGCSCVGAPAVVDTLEKQQYLMQNMSVNILWFAMTLWFTKIWHIPHSTN